MGVADEKINVHLGDDRLHAWQAETETPSIEVIYRPGETPNYCMTDRIRMDCRTTEKLADPRIHREEKISTNRYIYYLDLKNEGDIDGRLLEWLGRAYGLSNW